MLRSVGSSNSGGHDHADGAVITQEVAQDCCMGSSGGCHVRFIGHSKGGGLAQMALHRMLDPRKMRGQSVAHDNFAPFKDGVKSIAVYS